MSGGLGNRDGALQQLAESATGDPLDLLVVGGGVTGAGIALDAASRGVRVGLVERFDFASGTSSKSSKLIHGGLRYLEQREFGLVREASAERDLLRRLAPHLVEPIPFVLPVTSRKTRAIMGVGLWAYDALATMRNLKVHRHLDRDETEELLPLLPRGKVQGGYVYYDAKTDDVRLVMEILIQARRYGALIANHAEVRDLDGGAETCSAAVVDTITGNAFDVTARRIVVAAGVWADRLESMARPEAEARLRPSKGIHVLFSRDAVPVGDAAALIPDAERKRMLFVIPWHDAVLVGTTDTAYDGDIDTPSVEPADREYCLSALNKVFGLTLTDGDIAGAYAGLRPLVAGRADATADLSRKHTVYDIAPGIIGITGGKLTTWRRMAKDATDRVADDLGVEAGSRTRWIRLGCSDVMALTLAADRRAVGLGLSKESTLHLIRSFGDRALDVLTVAGDDDLTAPLAPGHPPIAAEAVYCARNEMATGLADLLCRRTRLALTDANAGIGPGSLAADVLAGHYRWSRKEKQRQLEAHRLDIERERGLPLGGAVEVPPAGDGATVGAG